MKPTGPAFDSSWRAECSVAIATRADVDHMIRKHYIGKWPGVCVLTLAMKRGAELLGVSVFALPPRETAKRYGGETWELARLWIADSCPQNTETWMISQSVKHIRRNHKSVRVLVSYADPSVGHSGTIYKAANWVSDGRTDQERKSPRFDYADANTGKRYSRRSHVPAGTTIARIPRVSKFRFIYRLCPVIALAMAACTPAPKQIVRTEVVNVPVEVRSRIPDEYLTDRGVAEPAPACRLAGPQPLCKLAGPPPLVVFCNDQVSRLVDSYRAALRQSNIDKEAIRRLQPPDGN